MATELGVGVRVYVGWTSTKRVFCNGFNPTCQVGTILSGPEYDLTAMDDERHVTKFLKGAAWEIKIDNDPYTCWVKEALLFPLDDGDLDPEKESTELDEPEQVGLV